ncbi:hypothetical protein [Chromobacterium violaceum]|uniref:hypothetical protein n=1 Tax=Chromobacterium violaceum TaxID=536 RepID=UPI00105503DC|nr:hypothetical protein [Chromobacterium violaceum]STB69113.1 Uncharacterised protein [Chromobacterium violaceum]
MMAKLATFHQSDGKKIFGLHRAELIGLIVFLILVFLGSDFGAFKRDYFEAHSLAMTHLHGDGGLIYLLKTIPNSASGVLPLWLYGFSKSYYVHKIFSLLTSASILILIINGCKDSHVRKYLFCSVAISPMFISATSWMLPEIFALLLVYFVHACVKKEKLSWFSVPLSFLVPISRQTFIVPIALRLFFSPRKLAIWLSTAVAATAALGLLYLIWGGLVPPRLMKVHNTPSIKSGLVALLIFSLYFLPFNIKKILNEAVYFRRLTISILIGLACAMIGTRLPALYGGGYFFTRIEAWNVTGAILIETLLYSVFFYKARLNVLLFSIVASVSFCTTNYMFLKYVDFYVLAFLSYALSDISKEEALLFVDYAKSIFTFQIFSLIVSILFYYKAAIIGLL